MFTDPIKRSVRFAIAGAAAATAYQSAGVAVAQDVEADGLEEVVVTGSRIRRVDAESASPILVIDSETISQSGVANAGDLLQRIPNIAGAAVNPAVNNGGGFGESNVELRGLDAIRTLVLLNGRRVGLVGASGAVDINQIPVGLIERVEVLKEGASAVYGSDAIAGAVNFITRTNVDGLEIDVDAGQTAENDGTRYSGNLLWGKTFDNGNFIVGGGYSKQEEISAGDREFSKFALYLYSANYSYAGGSSRTPTGRITLPIALNTNYGCTVSGTATTFDVTRRAGASGAALGDYRCFAGGSDRFNYQPFNLILTPQERSNFFTTLNYSINENIDTYVEFLYNRTSSGYEIAPLPFDAVADDTIVSANSIYNPFGVDFGGGGGANGNALFRLLELGTRRSSTSSASTIINAGLRGKLSGDWGWNLHISSAKLNQLARIDGYLLKSALSPAFGPSFISGTGVPTCGTPTAPISGCTPVNIFNLGGPGQADALRTISASYDTFNYYNTKSAALDFNGTVFELPAGPVQAAIGAEYRKLDGEFTASTLVQAAPPLFLTCGISQEACTGDSGAEYDSKELYAEALIPILKDAPLAKSLNLNVSTRFSDYNLFGNTTNSTLKLEYRPVDDVLVRATYSQVFRAPTIEDISAAPVNTSTTFADPCVGLTAAAVTANPNLALACVNVPRDGTFSQDNGQITGLLLSNVNLKPETGDVTTFGVVYDPSWLPNFSISLDFWKYKIEDTITQLDATFAINQCIATGDPTFCSLFTRFGAGPNAGDIQVAQQPTFNLGTLETNGIDLGVQYALRDTPIGTFRFRLDATKIDSYENVPAPGAAPVEVVGTYDRQFGNYAKVRAKGMIGWDLGNFDGMVSANYIGSVDLLNPAAVGASPPLEVPAYTYVDLTLGYKFEKTNTKVQFGVQNLGDKQPPILYQNNVTNANTDVQTYDTQGRRFWLSVSQKF